MNDGKKCAVEIIDAANRVGNPVRSAIEIVNSASEKGESGVFAIMCEKCGVQLDVSTELGDDSVQLKLGARPLNTTEACPNVQYRRDGDWVTNLGKRWFRIDRLGPAASETGGIMKIDDLSYSISSVGLEIALDDAAHNLARVRRARSEADGVASTSEHDQLEASVTAAVNVLDLVLSRQDGKTLREEVDERSAHID